MEYHKTVFPSEIDFLGLGQFWDVKDIQFRNVVISEDFNTMISEFFRFS